MENEVPQPESENSDFFQDRLKHQVLKAGESFGNYRVVRCLCAGLLANFYHMQHVRDLHDVTVVIFHPRTNGDESFFERLKRLQRRLGKFDHKAFPKILEYSEIDGRYSLFMDPLEGDNLSGYLSKHGIPGKSGIGPDKTMRILAQLYRALGSAHAGGFDHRDLDTDLIFVNDKGDLQILGLGLRSAVGVDLFELIVSVSVSPFSSNKTVGRLNSFDVISPEYSRGIEEDSRVDVYMVGFIGYWLLTGLKPDLSNLKPASQLVEFLPESWDAFFAYSLEKDREVRYRSCKLALLGLKGTDSEVVSVRSNFVQRQVDRIPVPGRIRQRGETTTRVYRLTLIGLVGLTLFALAASFLIGVFSGGTRQKEMIAVRAGEGDEPTLMIRVEPEQASVEVVSSGDRFTLKSGKLNLLIPDGQHKLKVSAPEYFSEHVMVDIFEGKPTRTVVQLKPAWAQLEIKARPETTVHLVNSSGVEIKIGEADSEGRYVLKKVLKDSGFIIVLKRAGYQPYRIEDSGFTLGALTTVDVQMEPLPSTLSVETIPEGAVVLIDDLEVGRTPLEGYGMAPDSEYVISVQLDGYRVDSREVVLDVDEEILVDFGKLTPRSGELEFNLTFEGAEDSDVDALLQGVAVLIDGDTRYDSLRAEALRSVPDGTRKVEVIHPFYEAEPIDVRVIDGATEVVAVTLQPKPAYLELVLPEGLKPEIRVDGVLGQLDNGQAEIPPAKFVEVELRIRDYLTMKRRLELGPGDRLKWVVAPTPIPAPVMGNTWTVPYLGMLCKWLPPGTFEMGSPLEEHGRIPNEGPLTMVTHSEGFWIGAYEVTQQEYQMMMDSNPSSDLGSNKPVDSVAWADALAFCSRLNEAESIAGRLPPGYLYRLPTEAEWEYAARAGTKTPFFFGEHADVTSGNFKGVYPLGWEEGQASSEFYGTRPVGSYSPNAFGLYDTHGNVSEWTLDRYNGRLRGGEIKDPLPRPGGKDITLRGGSWEDNAKHVRSAARNSVPKTIQSNSIGFRLVLAPEF